MKLMAIDYRESVKRVWRQCDNNLDNLPQETCQC